MIKNIFIKLFILTILLGSYPVNVFSSEDSLSDYNKNILFRSGGIEVLFKKDPFMPLMIKAPSKSVTEESGGKPSVSAIMFSQDRSLAIVNGKIVRIGDIVDSYKVIKITKNQVVVKGSSGIATLDVKAYEDNPINLKDKARR